MPRKHSKLFTSLADPDHCGYLSYAPLQLPKDQVSTGRSACVAVKNVLNWSSEWGSLLATPSNYIRADLRVFTHPQIVMTGPTKPFAHFVNLCLARRSRKVKFAPSLPTLRMRPPAMTDSDDGMLGSYQWKVARAEDRDRTIVKFKRHMGQPTWEAFLKEEAELSAVREHVSLLPVIVAAHLIVVFSTIYSAGSGMKI